MIWQYIIIALCLVAAIWFMVRKARRAFSKTHNCDAGCGCTSADLRNSVVNK